MSDEMNAGLNKAIIDLIDQCDFEGLEKSSPANLDVAGDSDTTADKSVAKAPKGQNDESRGIGRPKAISDIPQKGNDGSRTGTYSKDITENKNKEHEPSETDQVSTPSPAKKEKSAPNVIPFKKAEIEEFEEFQAFRAMKLAKSQNEVEAPAEPIAKAEPTIVDARDTLIKSQSEALEKSVAMMDGLQKALAMPQAQRSITNVQHLEKAQGPSNTPPRFTESQMLDGAEVLAKSEKHENFTMDTVIELEGSGRIFDADNREALENYLYKN